MPTVQQQHNNSTATARQQQQTDSTDNNQSATMRPWVVHGRSRTPKRTEKCQSLISWLRTAGTKRFPSQRVQEWIDSNDRVLPLQALPQAPETDGERGQDGRRRRMALFVFYRE